LYAFCTQATSVIALALAYSSVVTLLSPIAPIKPSSSRIATMASTCSSNGTPASGALRLVDAARVVAAGLYLGHQHELRRVRIEGGVDQFVRNIGPVGLGRIDAIHALRHRVAEDVQRALTVERRAERPRAG
jgi:hypothetical protein